jgi:hypothetical protein
VRGGRSLTGLTAQISMRGIIAARWGATCVACHDVCGRPCSCHPRGSAGATAADARCQLSVLAPPLDAAVLSAAGEALTVSSRPAPAMRRLLELAWGQVGAPRRRAVERLRADLRRAEAERVDARQRLAAAAVKPVQGDLDRAGYELPKESSRRGRRRPKRRWPTYASGSGPAPGATAGIATRLLGTSCVQQGSETERPEVPPSPWAPSAEVDLERFGVWAAPRYLDSSGSGARCIPGEGYAGLADTAPTPSQWVRMGGGSGSAGRVRCRGERRANARIGFRRCGSEPSWRRPPATPRRGWGDRCPGASLSRSTAPGTPATAWTSMRPWRRGGWARHACAAPSTWR